MGERGRGYGTLGNTSSVNPIPFYKGMFGIG